MERRAWILNPDESEEQTLRILEFKARLKEEEQLVKLGLRECTSKELALQVLKALVAKLEPVKVVVPYPKTLTDLLNYKVLRARGDFDKIYTLILLTAFLMQKKMPRLKEDVILATPSVILHALSVSAEPLTTMSTQLDRRIRILIQELDNLGIKKVDDVVNHENRVKIAKKLGKSEKTIRKYLKKMVEEGYAVEEADPNSKSKKQHRLIKSLEEIVAAYSSLKGGKDSGSREFPISTLQKAYHETMEFLDRHLGNFSPTVKEQIKADLLSCLASSPYTTKEKISTIFGLDEVGALESGKTRFPEALPDQQPKPGASATDEKPNPPSSPTTSVNPLLPLNSRVADYYQNVLKCSICGCRFLSLSDRHSHLTQFHRESFSSQLFLDDLDRGGGPLTPDLREKVLDALSKLEPIEVV
jgi:DNA-binding MarR family transcriptional regulator